MKKFTGVKFLKKIVIAFLTIILLFQFMMPIRSEATPFVDMELPKVPDIFRFMAQIVAGIGDIGMSMFNNAMLGTSGYGTAMISHEALDQSNSWFVNDGVQNDYDESKFDQNSEVYIGEDSSSNNIVVYVKGETLEKNIIADSDEWEVPNMLYCPENIFGNNIAMLDVNFLNPNEYKSVDEKSNRANQHAQSIADDKYDGEGDNKKVVSIGLKTTIKNWYRTLRNLAIVALLSILVYLGIRILISSTAEDKAKHKEVLKDWFIALILVFIMHFIMSAIIMIVNQVNSLFNNVNKSVYINYGGTVFKSNFTGVMRFLAQSTSVNQAWVYTTIYWALIVYTGIFTIQYLKRVLYIAFYTMISPLVAITYPLDKLGDGKSQAFNKWFKEYAMTMALQPIHLIIYTMVVSTALSLSIQNPIFALVAIGFLIPAEKFIRSLFGVESQADGGFGAFASGALTMQALNAFRKPKFGGSSGKGDKGSAGEDKEEDTKIRQANNKELDFFTKRGNGEQGDGADNAGGEEEQERPPLGNGNPDQDEHPPVIDRNVEPDDSGNQPDENIPWDEVDSEDSDYWNNLDKERGIDKDILRDDIDKDDSIIDKDGEYKVRLAEKRGKELEAREREKAIRERYEQRQREEAERREAEQESILAPRRAAEKYKNMRAIRRKRYIKNKLANAGITGAKTLGNAAKFTAKTAARGVGAATFGTIGLAAGIASGKGISGAWKGAAAGAAAGVAMGTTAANLTGKLSNKVVKDAKYTHDAINKYYENRAKDYKNAGDLDNAKKVQDTMNKLPVNSIKRNTKYNKMVEEYAMKNGKDLSGKQGKALRESLKERIADYNDNYGVTDKDEIFKGLELEEKFRDKFDNREDAHKGVAAVMQLKQSHGREYINNASKIEEFDNNLTNRGLSRKDKDLVKEIFHASHDSKYKKKN